MKTVLAYPILLISLISQWAAAYDPLQTSSPETIATLDRVVNDAQRNREIPVLIYLPQTTNAVPVLLFSHGLGGSRNNNAYLANHWTGRGYVCVFVQHPGSDESVWKNVPANQRMGAMQKAASAKNHQLRTEDIPAVINQLERWNQESETILHERMNLDRIGMSGHSFGAVTTQAVSGQWAGTSRDVTDRRIKAACAFSPSTPRFSQAEKVFKDVGIPWILMTGTKDISPIGGQDVESRLAVFPALPSGDKYELVLYNAEHMAFGDSPQRGHQKARNPNHHKAIIALSTAFWDTYLLDRKEAGLWLNENARSVLESEDRWQKK